MKRKLECLVLAVIMLLSCTACKKSAEYHTYEMETGDVVKVTASSDYRIDEQVPFNILKDEDEVLHSRFGTKDQFEEYYQLLGNADDVTMLEANGVKDGFHYFAYQLDEGISLFICINNTSITLMAADSTWDAVKSVFDALKFELVSKESAAEDPFMTIVSTDDQPFAANFLSITLDHRDYSGNVITTSVPSDTKYSLTDDVPFIVYSADQPVLEWQGPSLEAFEQLRGTVGKEGLYLLDEGIKDDWPWFSIGHEEEPGAVICIQLDNTAYIFLTKEDWSVASEVWASMHFTVEEEVPDNAHYSPGPIDGQNYIFRNVKFDTGETSATGSYDFVTVVTDTTKAIYSKDTETLQRLYEAAGWVDTSYDGLFSMAKDGGEFRVRDNVVEYSTWADAYPDTSVIAGNILEVCGVSMTQADLDFVFNQLKEWGDAQGYEMTVMDNLSNLTFKAQVTATSYYITVSRELT